MLENFKENSSENQYSQIEDLVTLPYDIVQELFVLKEISCESTVGRRCKFPILQQFRGS